MLFNGVNTMNKKTLSIPVSLFGIALGFPVSVYIHSGRDGLLLALQEVAFSVYLIFVFPLACYSVIQGMSLNEWRKLPSQRKLGWIAGGISLGLLVIAGSVLDARRAPFPPYFLKNDRHSNHAQTSQEMCEKLNDLRSKYLATNQMGKEAKEKKRTALRKDFEGSKSSSPFASVSDYWAGTSWVAWYALGLNTLVFLLAAFFYLFLIFKAFHPERSSAASKARQNHLMAGFTLICLWLPLRAYSEWLMNFFSFRTFQMLMPIMVAAVVGVALMVAISKPESLVKWWKIVTASSGLIISAAFITNPETALIVAQFLHQAELFTWIFSSIILAIGAVGVIKAISKLP